MRISLIGFSLLREQGNLAMHAFDPIPLQLLLPGQMAEVTELIGDNEQVVRLQELGLRRGQSVEMVQPGSPCIVRLEGHKLCFRDGDIFSVLVRPRISG